LDSDLSTQPELVVQLAKTIEAKSKVAILLATYNGSKYIREFLDSLVAQTYTDFKLMVRDDGSTDETLEIIHSYVHKIKIAFIEANVRLGPANSFFELLMHTDNNFDFYFFADQDDYWQNSKIERAVDKLSAKKEQIALYCSRLEYVDDNLAHIKYSRIPKAIAFENALVENIAIGCTVALTQSARQLIIENPPCPVIMQNWWFYHDWWAYIVIVTFGTVIYDAFPSIKYRQHDNNSLGAATNIFQDLYRRIKRFIKNDSGIFGLATQAKEFKRCFSWMLKDNQLDLLENIIDGKDNIIKRFKLAFASRLIRQRYFDTFILRALFLIGRF
jgi:glycosyltransferase involved in cell wall biosynthesis